jgi:hypothetical protein
MKKLIMFVVAALASSAIWAEVPSDVAVDDAMNRLNAAMIAGDAQKLRELTADSLSYGHSSGRIEDQKAFIEKIASGQTRYKRIELSKTEKKVNGNVAVVRNHFSGTVETAGKLSDVDFDALLVWQKEAGLWKLIARQGYKY